MSVQQVKIPPSTFPVRLTISCIVLGAIFAFSIVIVPPAFSFFSTMHSFRYLVKKRVIREQPERYAAGPPANLSFSQALLDLSELKPGEIHLTASLKLKDQKKILKKLSILPRVHTLTISGDWNDSIVEDYSSLFEDIRTLTVIRGSVKKKLWKCFPSVTNLYLYNVSVSKQLDKSLKNQVLLTEMAHPKKIKYLELNSCTSDVPLNFSQLSNLKDLTIENTKPSKTNIKYPKNLNYLKIDNKQTFHLEDLRVCSSLKRLDVSANRISSPKTKLHLPSISEVYLLPRERCELRNVSFGTGLQYLGFYNMKLDSFEFLARGIVLKDLHFRSIHSTNWEGLERISVSESLKIMQCNPIPLKRLPKILGSTQIVHILSKVLPSFSLSKIPTPNNLNTIAFEEVDDLEAITRFKDLHWVHISKQKLSESQSKMLLKMNRCSFEFNNRNQILPEVWAQLESDQRVIYPDRSDDFGDYLR